MMKHYIIEIPVTQGNEDVDGALVANDINGSDYLSLDQFKEKLKSLNIDKYYIYTVQNLVSHVNNGNDSFTDSYLAEITTSPYQLP